MMFPTALRRVVVEIVVYKMTRRTRRRNGINARGVKYKEPYVSMKELNLGLIETIENKNELRISCIERI
jgi:hypothetical protein